MPTFTHSKIRFQRETLGWPGISVGKLNTISSVLRFQVIVEERNHSYKLSRSFHMCPITHMPLKERNATIFYKGKKLWACIKIGNKSPDSRCSLISGFHSRSVRSSSRLCSFTANGSTFVGLAHFPQPDSSLDK